MNGLWIQRVAAFGLAILVTGMVALLAVAVGQLPAESRGLSEAVEANLDDAGASNSVTAVLLNFRAYDTLLELAVLLLAVLGAQVLAGDDGADGSPLTKDTDRSGSVGTERIGDPHVDSSADPVLRGFIRLVAPVMVVVAGYVLWIGGEAPGGAFQSGAVLAAMGILLLLSGVEAGPRISRSGERVALVAGLALFLAVGTAMLLARRQFLEYPVPGAKGLVLLIESAATVSIAATLVALFRGGRLVQRTRHEKDRSEPQP